MIGSLKLGAAIGLALGLLFVGWKVHGWRTEAAKVPVIEAALNDERNKRAEAERKRKEADDDRTLASAQLEVYRERTEDEIALLKARVPVLVNNSRACAFSRDVSVLLNDARRGGDPLPSTPGPASSGAIISSATP